MASQRVQTLFVRNCGHFSRFWPGKGGLRAKTAIDVGHLGERSYRRIRTFSAKRFTPARHAGGHWFKSSTAQSKKPLFSRVFLCAELNSDKELLFNAAESPQNGTLFFIFSRPPPSTHLIPFFTDAIEIRFLKHVPPPYLRRTKRPLLDKPLKQHVRPRHIKTVKAKILNRLLSPKLRLLTLTPQLADHAAEVLHLPITERTGRFVEDEDARRGAQSAGESIAVVRSRQRDLTAPRGNKASRSPQAAKPRVRPDPSAFNPPEHTGKSRIVKPTIEQVNRDTPRRRVRRPSPRPTTPERPARPSSGSSNPTLPRPGASCTPPASPNAR